MHTKTAVPLCDVFYKQVVDSMTRGCCNSEARAIAGRASILIRSQHSEAQHELCRWRWCLVLAAPRQARVLRRTVRDVKRKAGRGFEVESEPVTKAAVKKLQMFADAKLRRQSWITKKGAK